MTKKGVSAYGQEDPRRFGAEGLTVQIVTSARPKKVNWSVDCALCCIAPIAVRRAGLADRLPQQA